MKSPIKLICFVCLLSITGCTSAYFTKVKSPYRLKINKKEKCTTPSLFVLDLEKDTPQKGYIQASKIKMALNSIKKDIKGKGILQKQCLNNIQLLNIINHTRAKHINTTGMTILKESMNDEMSLYLIALGYLINDHLTGCLYVLDKLEKKRKSPYRSMYYNLRGLVEYKKKNYKKAISYFNRAIQINPNNLAAKLNMAFISLKFLDTTNSYSLLKTVSAKLQTYEIFFGLGLATMLKGQHKKAVDYFEKATDLKEDIGQPYYYLGLIYQKALKDNEEAIDMYNMFLQYSKNDPLKEKRVRLLVKSLSQGS